MFCLCGCGRKTTLATKTRRGCIKGQPTRYIAGHSRRKRPDPRQCACGCGAITTIKGGRVSKWIVGHQLKRDRTTPENAYDKLVAPKLVRRDSGCIEFTGYLNGTGYGVVRVGGRGGRLDRCHRIAYEALVGPLPKGAHVLHSCDNPKCCNPDHLRVGTHLENMRDMWMRGRARPGGRHGVTLRSGKVTSPLIDQR